MSLRLETHLVLSNGPIPKNLKRCDFILDGINEKEILQKLIRQFLVIYAKHSYKGEGDWTETLPGLIQKYQIK